MERSKLAVAAAFSSGLALFFSVSSPPFIWLGWIRPMVGFQAWALFSLVALIGLILGFFAIRATGSGKKAGRGFAIFGTGLGALVGGVFIFSAASGGGYPSINDVATDLDDPPVFASDPADRGRDMGYPADFVPTVKDAYPDLAPIETTNDPLRALDLAVQAAEGLGWEVVEADRKAGTLLARHTTSVFRFVDDVVVRVRPREGGAVVDLRSKSRDGQGDFGANAIRIRAFAKAYPR